MLRPRPHRGSQRGQRMTIRFTAFAAAAAVTLIGTSAAQAAYFVRPVLQYDGEFIDGLDLNGATSGSLTFNDGFRALESHVDLADGTIKTFLEVNGPGGFALATGVMGDRIRFLGDPATAVNFSFAFDGFIEWDQEFVGNEFDGQDRQVIIESYFAVYDAAVGATWDNWTVFGTLSDQALISQNIPLTFSGDDGFYSENVFNSDLGGSLNLVAGRDYDIFAAFNLIVSPGQNIGPITMNFLNTGTIGIDAPANSFTSQSGQFLGFAQTPGVPEPASWAMLIAGFGLVGAAARRHRDRVQMA